MNIYYGESKEEALDTAYTETYDKLIVDLSAEKDSVLTLSKSVQIYVNIISEGDVSYDVSMLYEFLDVPDKGYFRCNDQEVNNIWDVADYTIRLTTPGIFIDGIKRDRWIWRGDAYQKLPHELLSDK